MNPRHIESDAKKEKGDASSRRVKSANPAQFLNSLKLNEYRPFPLIRNFSFGEVNLIFCPNACGKTSLLEAIELFYCGRNKRNIDRKPTYDLDGLLANGITEKATSARNQNLFRERNLSWYGQAEVKTNNLYKSFAQFNFLDTDAAVSLSESTERIEEDLSKLLVGPDISKIWRDIERVDDGVDSKLKELVPYKSQISTELSRVNKLLSELSSERQQSDIILDRLSKMLERHKWKLVHEEPERFLESLNGSLTELLSVAQQAIELKWVDSPTTYIALEKFVQETSNLIEATEPKLLLVSELRKKIFSANNLFDQHKHTRKLVNEIIRYLDSGFLELASKHSDLKKLLESYSKLFRSYDDQFFAILSNAESEGTIVQSLESASIERSTAETELFSYKKEYSEFSSLRDDSLKLSQQLRQIAGSLIDRAENPDECPLCHTRFESGNLAIHMKLGVDDHLEALGQSLLSRISESENLYKRSLMVEAAFTWLQKFCQNSLGDLDFKVQEAVAHLTSLKNENSSALQTYKVIDNELFKLIDSGFSVEDFEDLLSKLKTLGFKLEDRRKESVEQMLLKIDDSISSQSEATKQLTEQLDETESDLKEVLNLSDIDPHFEEAISTLRENISATETIILQLSEFKGEFGWPHDRPFSDLIAIADGVRKVSSEAYAAIIREQRVNSQQSEGLKRQEHLKRQLEEIDKRIEKFTEAHAVFKNIRKHHSLNQAMEATLNLNRESIETIFASIHSPAEFSGLGPTLATLVRKIDDSHAKLTEISTGQRAAFGLSIFLAQNSQLTTAPPVLLIDDPIAHVDDLNSLSFLDYLREIALTGKRQIFFATANDKLATLFERKFDFLGVNKFRRFNLSREEESKGSE